MNDKATLVITETCFIRILCCSVRFKLTFIISKKSRTTHARDPESSRRGGASGRGRDLHVSYGHYISDILNTPFCVTVRACVCTFAFASPASLLRLILTSFERVRELSFRGVECFTRSPLSGKTTCRILKPAVLNWKKLVSLIDNWLHSLQIQRNLWLWTPRNITIKIHSTLFVKYRITYILESARASEAADSSLNKFW